MTFPAAEIALIAKRLKGEKTMGNKHVHVGPGDRVIVHRNNDSGCLVYIAGFIILYFLFSC